MLLDDGDFTRRRDQKTVADERMFHPAIIDPDEETDSEQSWIELQPRHTEMGSHMNG
jgi:hypothetical protein